MAKTQKEQSGAKVSEVRYTPWGEIRYSWTAGQSTMPSYTLPQFTFTGQRSYMDDPSTSAVEGFGLMFYNARWYDPSLGRFAQADTIVPGGVQGWDRYAYANNNPLKYTDPSGHRPVCDEPSECYHEPKISPLLIFRTDGGENWTQAEKDILNANVRAVAGAIARAINKENWMLWKSGDVDSYSTTDPTHAFYETFGGSIVVRRSSSSDCHCWAQYMGRQDGQHPEIWVYHSTSTNDIINHPLLLTHEIAHAFDAARGIDANSVIPNDLLRPVNSDGIVGTDANGGNYGYAGPHYQWQFGRDPNNRAGEEFADMFVGWVYNQWESSDLGIRRQEFMNTLMVNYLP